MKLYTVLILVFAIFSLGTWACNDTPQTTIETDDSENGSGDDSASDDSSNDSDDDSSGEPDNASDSEIQNDSDANPDVFIDPYSDLVWQKTVSNNTMNWDGALSYCDSLDVGGYGDWRLPTIEELISLVRGCDKGTLGTETTLNSCSVDECVQSSCDSGYGPGIGGTYLPAELGGEQCWSSSNLKVNDTTTNSDVAYFLNPGTSHVGSVDISDTQTARCVRTPN